MKNKNKLILAISIILLATISSCVKNAEPLETNFSNLEDHVEIVKSGLTNFSNTNIGFNGNDTVTVKLIVNLASVNLPASPIVVTLGVDSALISTYNATNDTHFKIVPSFSYILGATSLTIPAGQQYVQTTVSFIADSLDPAISYMLPISILNASGKALTSNLNTAYYNIIGNPIAGVYEEYWSRWNASDSSSGAAGALYYQTDVGPVVFAAVSPTEVSVTSAGTGETELFDFVNSSGTLSSFATSFPSTETAASLGLTSIGPITLLQADPIAGVYEVYFPYVNGSGSPRVIKNLYIKQ